MTRPFAATNKPGTCLWCGKKFRVRQEMEWDDVFSDGREEWGHAGPPEVRAALKWLMNQ